MKYMVTIEKNYSGQRIDNFLIAKFKKVPKTRIYRAVRSGEIRINGSRIKFDYRLKADDLLRVPPIWCTSDDADSTLSNFKDLDFSWISKSIIFENDDFYVFDKPCGLAVHGGSKTLISLIKIIQYIRPEEPYIRLAHRIDKETSGCVVLTKNRKSLLEIQNLFSCGLVEKEYMALVHGIWKEGEFLKRSRLKKCSRYVKEILNDEDGKESYTKFTPVKFFNNCTLLRIKIFTGRTHQIRVQASSLGYPIIGDDKYGYKKNQGNNVTKNEINRLFLHAHKISFRINNKNFKFEIPVPKSFYEFDDIIVK